MRHSLVLGMLRRWRAQLGSSMVEQLVSKSATLWVSEGRLFQQLYRPPERLRLLLRMPP